MSPKLPKIPADITPMAKGKNWRICDLVSKASLVPISDMRVYA